MTKKIDPTFLELSQDEWAEIEQLLLNVIYDPETDDTSLDKAKLFDILTKIENRSSI